jgi:hypothetical protein
MLNKMEYNWLTPQPTKPKSFSSHITRSLDLHYLFRNLKIHYIHHFQEFLFNEYCFLHKVTG